MSENDVMINPWVAARWISTGLAGSLLVIAPLVGDIYIGVVGLVVCLVASTLTLRGYISNNGQQVRAAYALGEEDGRLRAVR